MGFFKKLFRRKGRKKEDTKASKKLINRDSPTTALDLENTAATRKIAPLRGVDTSEGAQRVVLQQRTPNNGHGPVDLDQEVVDSSPGDNDGTAARQHDFQATANNKPVFSMGETKFSAGHMATAVEESDGDSSFNLSTDASDNEYNRLRQSHPPPPAGDTTDGENTIFPNLPTDDEGTTATPEGSKSPTGNLLPAMDSPQQWVKKTTKAAAAAALPQSFEKTNDGFPKTAFDAPDAFVFAKETKANGNAAFANDFANWESVDWLEPASTRQVTSPTKSQSSRSLVTKSSSKQQQQQAVTTDINQLLAKANSYKGKGRSGSSSVNSAPAVSASSIRQQLKNHNTFKEGRPVSEIIKNLEEDKSYRLKKSRRHKDGGESIGSRDAASVRSAKERLRRRRERERVGNHDSSDSDGENTESWIIEGVTDAIGPRGIAADLESLSGRSSRSHKSHRSSKHQRRRNSSRRIKNSSGESVDSHGSRKSHGSRRSRSSRYSHRSTRSYISQMSEQSRSVANDLLRLEMQLAMVHPSTAANDDPDGKITRSSRRTSSRRNGSSQRRSRMTVTAPPGKLGIILANKADARGTVVSGVRTSSVLADQVSPGDRIVAIDGEDVSLMTVSEITTIMTRKSEYERRLTVLSSSASKK